MTNRIIKFRAWDKELKEFLTWEELIIEEYNDVLMAGFEKNQTNIILQQFTGLLDKNGKEIWEGDVVKYKFLSGFNCENDYPNGGDEIIKEVRFINGEFYPKPTYQEIDDGYYSYRMFDFEIIGNIFENPELL